MGGLLVGIVGLVVGIYVAAALLPDAVVDISNATLWEGAPAAVITLGSTITGIICVVAFIMILLKHEE